MLTREFENILKSLPAFVSMVWDARSPFLISESSTIDGSKLTAPTTTIETIVKSAWFIVPFHFLAFFGLAPSGSDNVGIVVLLAFISLVLVSWLGIAIGTLASVRSPVSEKIRNGIAASWTAALVISWFYCVLGITIVNFWLWYRVAFSGGFPNLIDNLELLLVNGPSRGLETVVVALLFPVVGALSLLLTFGKSGRGGWRASVIVFAICSIVAFGMILLSIHFLSLTATIVSSQ